jgi:hypothetical protein
LAAETAMAMAMAAAIPVARLIAARAAPDRARKRARSRIASRGASGATRARRPTTVMPTGASSRSAIAIATTPTMMNAGFVCLAR